MSEMKTSSYLKWTKGMAPLPFNAVFIESIEFPAYNNGQLSMAKIYNAQCSYGFQSDFQRVSTWYMEFWKDGKCAGYVKTRDRKKLEDWRQRLNELREGREKRP